MLRAGQLWRSKYSVAVFVSLLALVLRLLLTPILKESAPLLVFIMPVVFSAWYGGFSSGLLATGLCALLGTYFFVPPSFAIAFHDISNAVRVGIFLIEGWSISWLSEALLRAKRQAERSTLALRQSEEQYRLLVEGVKDYAILGLDPDGYITTWNSGAVLIKGYSEAEALGRHFSILYTEADLAQDKPAQLLQTAIARGRVEDEGWRRRKDGSQFRARVIITALRDEAGQLQGFSKIVQDITERAKAEATQHQLLQDLFKAQAASDLERKRLRTVLDLLPVGVFITDANGRLLEANAAARQIWGETPPNFSQIEDYSQFKGWWVQTQQPIAAHEWALARAIERGETSINEAIDIETFEGDRKTILNSAVPIRNERNEIVNAVVVHIDITQRRQTERQLQRSAQRLRVVHQIDQAILRSDSISTIADSTLSHLAQIIPFDQAAVMLFDFVADESCILSGEIAGRTSGSVIPLDACFSVQSLKYREALWYIKDLANMIERPPVLDQQFRAGYHSFLAVALRANGSLIGDIMLFASAPNSFGGDAQDILQEVAHQIAIAIQQARLRSQLQQYTQVLEERVAERTSALVEANESLSAFNYSASHDLKAPLRAIQGLSQALLEDYGDQLDATGKLYATQMVTAAQQADQLISDLLQYSQLARTDITAQPLNLDKLVQDVLAQLADSIRSQNAQVTVEQPLPKVVGHYPTLVQAVMNLMTNAIKFVPSDRQPQVRIWSQNQADRVRLWVEDNGLGIDPGDHERIFQAFERLHTTTAYPGTGVGLAIVRRGIERMGGQVGVESALGQGSRFWIDLPVAFL